MSTNIKQPWARLEVIELLTKIAEVIFVTNDPLLHAYEIVRQTALSHEADISTIFLVEDRDHLVLKAGVAYLRNREIILPQMHRYEINWDAKSEFEMIGQGLTVFVAASGKALNIESYEELMNKQLHIAHSGRWDEYIYPDGVDHPETGFGCMYAVPLKRPPKSKPKDTVIGVFKIERRKNRQPFSDNDRMIFDLVAAHLSLLLQSYFRVQNRVFSDVAHAIGGGLGRTKFLLSTCKELLQLKYTYPSVLDLIGENINNAIEMMDRACRRLDLVIDTSRDQYSITEESIGRLWESIVSEVELKADLKLDTSKVSLKFGESISTATKLRLRVIEYMDLISILGNLLDNAIRHGTGKIPAEVFIRLGETDGRSQLVFHIEDRGPGLKQEVIDELKKHTYIDIYNITGVKGVMKGTGLRRVFGLAKQNNWYVRYKTDNGSVFEIITPDFRQGVGTGEKVNGKTGKYR